MSKEFDATEWYGGLESSYADDSPAQVKCDACYKYTDTDELDRSGNCPTCAAELRPQEDDVIQAARAAANFLTAPTLAGLLGLMEVR